MTTASQILNKVHRIRGMRTIAEIEVGVREDENGNLTVNSAVWDDDADLDDTIPLSDALKHVKAGDVLDMYCYGPTMYCDEIDLIGNLDLTITSRGSRIS